MPLDLYMAIKMNECKKVNGGSHLRGFVVGEVVAGGVVVGEVVAGGVVAGGVLDELITVVLPVAVVESVTPLKQDRNC